jgi:hypothetical protein
VRVWAYSGTCGHHTRHCGTVSCSQMGQATVCRQVEWFVAAWDGSSWASSLLAQSGYGHLNVSLYISYPIILMSHTTPPRQLITITRTDKPWRNARRHSV